MRQQASSYSLSNLDSSSINILKLWLIVGVVFIHSVKGEIHFVGGNLNFEMPMWLNYLEYIVQDVISRSAVPAYFVLSALLLW